MYALRSSLIQRVRWTPVVPLAARPIACFFSTTSSVTQQKDTQSSSSSSPSSSSSSRQPGLESVNKLISGAMSHFGQTSPRKFSLNQPDYYSTKDIDSVALEHTKIPRTGPKAGRTVEVKAGMSLQQSLRILNSLNRQSNVRRISMSQKIYEKPGKKAQRLKVERKKKLFNENIKRMFELVSEARRKGY